MPDDDGPVSEFRVVDDREHLLRPKRRIVGGPATAVAHSRQVERGDAAITREEWRDGRPPARVRAAAVHEQHAGRAAATGHSK